MSEIADRIATHLVEPLGWTLVHSIWQLACLAAVLAIAIRLLGRRSADARYALCGVTLCLMVSFPAATYFFYLPSVEMVIDATFTTPGQMSPMAETGPVWEPPGAVDAMTAVPLTADTSQPESGVLTKRATTSVFTLKPLIQPSFPWIVAA